MDKNYAGFWKRIAAGLIDILIVSMLCFVVGLAVTMVSIPMQMAKIINLNLSIVIFYLSYLITFTLYFVLGESSKSQGTFGKNILGIQIVDLAGNKINSRRAAGRFFAKIISAMIFLLGFLIIPFTQKKQGIHDLIADTLVVVK